MSDEIEIAVEIDLEETVEEAQFVTEDDRDQISTYLKSNELFSVLDDPSRNAVASKARYKWISPGEVVVRESEEGETFYVIKSGSVEVSTTAPDGSPLVLATLKSGGCFGEVSVFHDTKRTATVTALEDVELYEISKSDTVQIVENSPAFESAVESLILLRTKDTISKMGLD